MYAVVGLGLTFIALVGWFWTARQAKSHPNRHPLVRRGVTP
jgi:hypothetical protein